MEKKSLGQRLLSAPYTVWAILFCVVPLGMVVYYSFTDNAGNFTVANLAHVSSYANIFLRSIGYSLAATVLCLVLGYPLALAISQAKANSQRIMVMLLMLPQWMNLLLRTYALMNLMEDTGIINTLLGHLGLSPIHMINTPGAVVFGMVYNYLPYMVLPLYTVMLKIERSTVEAAQDLGGSSLTVLTKVLIPLSLPGIASGLTMVFVPSVSTFYISQKLGGGKFDLIGDTIERQFMTAYDYHLGAAISLVLMILIFICMGIMNRFTDDDEEGGVLM